ncbi:SNF1-related protein kinase regulatory subunit beta-2-like isoform X3 [Syzygium oleosum]|nr:SNF1-related protein kinase regulatory subunit beta-2-like isoform X3 [Syzygium oleosum]XP_056172482.1 SNF1-related protein kinase regulatory subunit beta-2-like isoform X3 [Syzygium oleosum]
MMANQSLDLLWKMNYEATCHERRTPVMITWNHGGKQVAVKGSWDNWEKTEPMQRSGQDFIILKVLPCGVYHYHFVVDGQVKCAPDLPCDFHEPRAAYNILDVKEYAAEACQSESEVMHPPSPDASYSRNSIIDLEFSKPPPDLPPQLHRTLLNESSNTDCYQFPTRPRHVALNHLYMKSCDRGQAIAFGSTHRFLEKYVTVILYKPSYRQVKER